MRFPLLIIAMLFICVSSSGQTTPPSLIPPSPNSYSLAKYGDIPVSLYTGVPNISIPLVTINAGPVNVDINLSYHAAGHKVDEIASFVGLGWSLNAGGSITRVVHGKPEYVSSSGQLRPERANLKFRQVGQSVDAHIAQNNFDHVATGNVDGEPDVFFYNFNGRSGKFVFDTAKVARFVKDERLDVNWSFVNLGLTKFIIKDELGTKFEFEETETTANPGDQAFVSAWYLTKITSVTGRVITFEYNNYSSTQYNRSYSKVLHELHPTNTNITLPTYNVPFQGSNQSELQISKINFSNGYVKFDYKTQARQDVPSSSPRALEYVGMYELSGKCLKRYKLSSSYFEANNGSKYDGSNPANFNYLNYRLRLDAVQEIDAMNTVTSPPYIFTYLGDNNPSTNDAYTLPYRLSPAQDHWGHFNHSSNTHLLPGKGNEFLFTDVWFTEFMGDDNVPEGTNAPLTGGANRNHDTAAVKACMLSRITYPTGGYTEFVFKSNLAAANTGGVHISKIVSQPLLGPPKTTLYNYVGHNAFDPMKYYFEYYRVQYGAAGTAPGTSVRNLFGLPNTDASSGTIKKYISITTHPQVVLGPGSQIGFSNVIQREVGNGSIETRFASNADFFDYTSRDVFNEETPAENNMVNELYVSEYVSSLDFPVPGGVSVRRTEGGFGNWPYPEHYSNDWKRGLVTERLTKSETNQTLKKEDFVYSRGLLTLTPGWKVLQIGFEEYVYQKYYIPSGRILEIKREVSDFGVAGSPPLKSTVETFYDNPLHLQPTRVLTTTSKNEKLVTTLTYPLDYPSGNTFIDNLKDNHVLALPVEAVKYKEHSGNINIISGTVTKYKLGGKGLKDEVFALETTSQIPLSSFKFSNRTTGMLPFTGTSSTFSLDSRYKPRIEYRRYDLANNLTEVAPTGNQSTSYIWGYNQEYPIAEATNARSNEIFFSGFEDPFDWDGTLRLDKNVSHSGRGSGRIDNTNSSNELVSHSITWLQIANSAPKKYKFSGWIYSNGPSAEIFLFMKTATETGYYSLVDPVYTSVVGQWVYIEKEYLVPANITRLGLRLDNNGVGSVWFDDIRLHPSAAQMKTFTYTPLIGVTSTGDINNRYTHYYYDEFNRLIMIKDNDGNIINKYCYNYSGQTQNCEIHFNTIQTGSFTKACSQGGVGSSIIYKVPAGRYISTISPQAADQQALADVNTNGQAYANEVGVCTFYSAPINGYYYSTVCSNGTPQPYPAWVPANKYSSTISQGAANALAAADAQQQANLYGSCTSPVELTYNNYWGQLQYVMLTNVSTYQSYYFTLEGGSSGVLGSVPEGTYDIMIEAPLGGYNSYQVGCNYGSDWGTTYIYGVILNYNCKHISVN